LLQRPWNPPTCHTRKPAAAQASKLSPLCNDITHTHTHTHTHTPTHTHTHTRLSGKAPVGHVQLLLLAQPLHARAAAHEVQGRQRAVRRAACVCVCVRVFVCVRV
jgi:hypothetical protein